MDRGARPAELARNHVQEIRLGKGLHSWGSFGICQRYKSYGFDFVKVVAHFD